MTYVSDVAPSGLPSRRERKLPVAECAAKTWQTFRAKLWPFVGLALLPVPISLVTSMFATVGAMIGNSVVMAIILIAVNIAQFGVQLACQGGTIYGGVRILSGTSFTLGEAISVGFRRLLPVTGIGLLAAIVIVIGLSLFIIPGLIAAAALSLALPVCLIETRGPIASFQRSLTLSQGNWWRIIGAILLSVFLPLLGVLLAIALVWGLLSAAHLQMLALLLFPLLLIVILAVTAAAPIILSVIYVELRAIKEGITPRDTVAGVFD